MGTGTSFLSSSVDSIITEVRALLKRLTKGLVVKHDQKENAKNRIEFANKASMQSPILLSCMPASSSVMFLPTVSLAVWFPGSDLAKYVYGAIWTRTPPSVPKSIAASARGKIIAWTNVMSPISIPTDPPVASVLGTQSPEKQSRHLFAVVDNLLKQILLKRLKHPGL